MENSQLPAHEPAPRRVPEVVPEGGPEKGGGRKVRQGSKTKVLASAHFPSPRMEGEKATGCRSAGRALPTRFFGAAGWENMIFTGLAP